jgi:hypothetical protein
MQYLIVRQKGVAPILVLLIIAVLGGLGFWGYKTEIIRISLPQKETASVSNSPSPTTDPTKDWKTYTDTTYNFSFKYPNSGSVKTNSKRDDLLLGGASFHLNYNDSEFRPQVSEVYVNVFDNNNLDLDTWLEQNSTGKPFGSDDKKEYSGYVNLGKGQLSGKSGVKFRDDVMGFTAHNIAVKWNNYIYVVGYVEVADDLSTEYSQILSTFKFTQ